MKCVFIYNGVCIRLSQNGLTHLVTHRPAATAATRVTGWLTFESFLKGEKQNGSSMTDLKKRRARNGPQNVLAFHVRVTV